MTQTLNASHTSVSRGELLAQEASTRKQAGRQNTCIGHVGLPATNPAAWAEFYRDVLGMEIVGGSGSDHPLGATAFLCSRPDEESHEIVLLANPAHAHVAFKVFSLAELRFFYARIVEKKIPIKFVFNHRVSFSFYFDDPDGNMIEVYWPTGDLSWRQPQVEPLDLSQPDEVLLEKITAARTCSDCRAASADSRRIKTNAPRVAALGAAPLEVNAPSRAQPKNGDRS
jgi:catechol-2,3-dioxygenase